MNDSHVAWCMHCGVHLTQAKLDEHGLPSCPKCGYDGYPCVPADDVSVDINWHELRILTIWAMNYANDTEKPQLRQTVAAICRRLQGQYPDNTPLTMAGEFKQIAEMTKVTNMEVWGMPDFDEMVEVYGPGAVKQVDCFSPMCGAKVCWKCFECPNRCGFTDDETSPHDECEKGSNNARNK